MKKTFLAATMLLFSYAAGAAYDSSWYQTEYWSGEWPNGFSVVKSGFSVTAREGMDKDLPRTISCELPQKAVYNPWNVKGNELRKTRYFTASKIVILTAKKKFSFKEDGREMKPILIRKGQKVEYLIYGSEGYFMIRLNGQEYTAGQDFLEKMEPVSEDAYVQEEWLNVLCGNGTSAWIFMADLKQPNGEDLQWIDGLKNASIGDPGVDGFGEARDLRDDEL